MTTEQIEETIKNLTPESICRVLDMEYPVGHVFDAGFTVVSHFSPSDKDGEYKCVTANSKGERGFTWVYNGSSPESLNQTLVRHFSRPLHERFEMLTNGASVIYDEWGHTRRIGLIIGGTSDGKAIIEDPCGDLPWHMGESDYLYNLTHGEPAAEEAEKKPTLTYLFGLSPEEAVRVLKVMDEMESPLYINGDGTISIVGVEKCLSWEQVNSVIQAFYDNRVIGQTIPAGLETAREIILHVLSVKCTPDFEGPTTSPIIERIAEAEAQVDKAFENAGAMYWHSEFERGKRLNQELSEIHKEEMSKAEARIVELEAYKQSMQEQINNSQQLEEAYAEQVPELNARIAELEAQIRQNNLLAKELEAEIGEGLTKEQLRRELAHKDSEIELLVAQLEKKRSSNFPTTTDNYQNSQILMHIFYQRRRTLLFFLRIKGDTNNYYYVKHNTTHHPTTPRNAA